MAPSRDWEAERQRMVEREIASRGIVDDAVLLAMRAVPRERFVPEAMKEFAYADSPLPIAEGQTISQPVIVALMAESAELTPQSRVLEVGAGSGYGAAVLGEIVAEVWTIERHEPLADEATDRLADLGYDNVHVVHGDGTLGLPEAAPFDAIIVTAGGPTVPAALVEQLVEGGRLILPVGPETRSQRLLRVRRRGDDVVEEDLGPVQFVPLIGAQGFEPAESSTLVVPRPTWRGGGLAALVREAAQPFDSISNAEVDALLDRVGDCSIVLLGEASHGTSEFYRMREHITRALIERKGFNTIAIEGDWPDAARVDAYVRDFQLADKSFEAFSRFPTWMWRNREVRAFVDWLHEHNHARDPERRVSFHGLDIYSLYRSRDAVLAYLDRIDPHAAATARHRYSCLTPWEHDPASYGRAVVGGRFAGCEDDVVATLTDLLRRRLEYETEGRASFFDAAQNAVVVANAERYYRVMYQGTVRSWNERDQHMFETMQALRAHRGPGAKMVVWEHNSHVGDASATEMGARGEHNVGMLTRQTYGSDAYLVGFGTHDGTVAAASTWGGAMERKAIRPSHSDSYERICHDSGVPAFLLHLRDPERPALRDELSDPRLERAIGVIYRPETELQSHYFQASLPHQFDEYIWFDRTSAVHPIAGHETAGVPDTYPFGL